MEIILTLLGFVTVMTVFIVSMEEDMNKNFLYVVSAIFVSSLLLWLGVTETNDVELQIHEATSNDKSFSYYVGYEGRLIPVPNNTVRVIKTEPRAWSVASDKYKVIVE